MTLVVASRTFMSQVQQGLKRQTIRKWNRKTNIQPGQVIEFFNFRERLPVRVLDIYQKPAHTLTDEEAQHNGHSSASSLLQSILETYQTLDFNAIVIKFEPVE